jgi:hypothetical protein
MATGPTSKRDNTPGARIHSVSIIDTQVSMEDIPLEMMQKGI